MTASVILFYVYALAALAGAIGLVTAKRLVHAVMWLLMTLVAIAALFLLMGSEFLAAMQLFVYGGAITVLVLFVLMLTRPSPEAVSNPTPARRALAAGVTVALFSAVAVALSTTPHANVLDAATDTATVAELLFSRYLVPFEIAGLLLTIALVGAVVIARESPGGDRARADSTESTGIREGGGTT